MQGEVWKDIPSYEGLYQASNMGQVRSLPRTKDYGVTDVTISNIKMGRTYRWVK